MLKQIKRISTQHCRCRLVCRRMMFLFIWMLTHHVVSVEVMFSWEKKRMHFLNGLTRIFYFSLSCEGCPYCGLMHLQIIYIQGMPWKGAAVTRRRVGSLSGPRGANVWRKVFSKAGGKLGITWMLSLRVLFISRKQGVADFKIAKFSG